MSNAIEQRIDKDTTGTLAFGGSGSMAFSNMNQVMEFAKIMAISGVAVPKHLRETPGACLAVCIQAMEWQMSPFAVANKSYSVNDRMAYEAQLVNAVILRRAPIIGRFQVTYSGAGETRRCKVVANTADGPVEYESPEFRTIPTKNSPLWKGDPDQQLFYYSSRAMCRRHFPDVILGIYTQDELESEAPRQVSGRVVPVTTSIFSAPALPNGPLGEPTTGANGAPLETEAAPAAESFSLEAEPEYPENGTPEEQLEWLLKHHAMSEGELFEILHRAKLVPKACDALALCGEKTIANLVARFGLIVSEREGGAL
jgi:hypothetical protein